MGISQIHPISTRFRVRKQSSGYTASVTYFVARLGGGRVSVHANSSREAAQAEADALNVSHMVSIAREGYDDRPYAVIAAECRAAYDAWVSAGRNTKGTVTR